MSQKNFPLYRGPQTFVRSRNQPNVYRAEPPNPHVPQYTAPTFPSSQAPYQFGTTQNYSQTFAGPITPDATVQRTARNDSMAKAAFAGNQRAYLGQSGAGVGAGGKMAAYKAGVTADTEAGKAYAQGNQDLLNLLTSTQSANLNYQQQQAGENSILRDLLLDRDDIQNRERMAAYKRRVDWEQAAYQRRAEDAVARDRREAEIWSSLM